MPLLVDTSIWSLALRRRPQQLNRLENHLVESWNQLIREEQVVLIGPIRQELLSGIKRETDFLKLQKRLSAFDDLPLRREDYEQAAKFFNQLRTNGITGTATDLLICSVAHHFDIDIFTSDSDFERYADHLSIRLYQDY